MPKMSGWSRGLGGNFLFFPSAFPPLVFFPPSSSGGRKKWEHTHDATPPFPPSSFASGILNSSSLPPLVSLLSSSVFFSSIPFFRRKSFSRNFSSLLQCGEKGGGKRGKGRDLPKLFGAKGLSNRFATHAGQNHRNRRRGTIYYVQRESFSKSVRTKNRIFCSVCINE